jgi:hypothetical protein
MPKTYIVAALLAGAFFAGAVLGPPSAQAQAPSAPLAAALAIPAVPADAIPAERWSPRIRAQALPATGLPDLPLQALAPWLTEPGVIDPAVLARAPRIVAAGDARVLLSRGDRAYVRGPAGAPVAEPPQGAPQRWVVVRGTRPLRDPVTGELLGHEARTLGRGVLVRGEQAVPATFDIVSALEDLRAGDRLLPEPPPAVLWDTPRPPEVPLPAAAIAAVYGDAVSTVGPHQVVAINKGRVDGLAQGHVLQALRGGRRLTDRTAPPGDRLVQLPDEPNGRLLVFRVFERAAYALVLDTATGLQVGDRLHAGR